MLYFLHNCGPFENYLTGAQCVSYWLYTMPSIIIQMNRHEKHLNIYVLLSYNHKKETVLTLLK